MDVKSERKKRRNQLKFNFNDDELALLVEVADGVDLGAFWRAEMLKLAAKRKGLSKARLRGNVRDSVKSPESRELATTDTGKSDLSRGTGT